jgi:hypothetical protein
MRQKGILIFATLLRGARARPFFTAATLIDVLKVGVGTVSVIADGLTVLACLTVVEIALIAAHFARQRHHAVAGRCLTPEAADRATETHQGNR